MVPRNACIFENKQVIATVGFEATEWMNSIINNSNSNSGIPSRAPGRCMLQQ